MNLTSSHNSEVDWTAAQSLTALSHADLAYEETLSNLALLLDECHGVSYGKEGWRIALGAWLLHLVHPITAYLNDSAPIATPEGQLTFPCFDHSTFLSDLSNSLKSQTVFRNMIKILRQNCRDNQFAEKNMRKKINGYIPVFNQPDLNLINLRGIYTPSYTHKTINDSFSLNQICNRWSLSGAPIKASFKVDHRWRLSNFDHQDKSDLSAICLTMAKFCLPVIFLEAFPVIRKNLISKDSCVFYTANSFYSDPSFCLYLAENQTKTHLLHHQHGGGYGIDKKHSLENFERSVSKTYFTWGWNEDDKNHSLKPLSIPMRLFRVPQKKMVKECLLVCVSFPKFIYRLQCHPTANRAYKLVDDTIQFTKNINSSVKLKLRPYHKDYGDNLVNRLPDQIKIKIEKKEATRLWREQSQCIYPLIITNYLGTLWLETLAANIPTICFYDPKSYAFRKDAMPFINELLDADILHTSPESAAEKVNLIHDEPEEWWQGNEIQDLRERFCFRYARMSENWVSEWSQAFNEELSLSL